MNVQNSNPCTMYVYSVLYSCSGNAEAMHFYRGDVVAMNLQFRMKNKSTNENVFQSFFPFVCRSKQKKNISY